MAESLQQLLVTNFGLSPSGYTGSQGAAGYTGSSGTNGYTGSAGAAGSGILISNIQVTDSSYTVLDDTAVDTAGGYIKITGSGFASGCTVLINQTPATSVTFVSSTEVRAQVPATAAGTYIVYLVNTSGDVAIRVNGITFSATPTWISGSSLSGVVDTAISIQLSATSAATYSLQAGSTLPSGVTLSNVGLVSGTVTGLSSETVYNFTVVATDAESQDSPRAFALTITVGDPYFKNTTLLLQGASTTFADDASPNNFAVTVNGDTKPNNFNPYTPGYYSSYFDGTGDYLSAPSNSVFAFGTGDFTFECWIYVTATFGTTGSGRGAIISNRTIVGSSDTSFVLQHYNGKIYFGTVNTDIFPTGGNTTMTINTWYHVAVTRSSGTARLFLNGVLDATVVTGNTTNFSDTSATYIGCDGSTFLYPYTGYISNARIVKGTAVYTANFTPSTTPLTSISGTSLLTCQSNRFIDNSSNNFTITRTGDTSIKSFTPFTPNSSYSTYGSAYFDGTGDSLQLPSSSNFLLQPTTAWTLEAWIYPTTNYTPVFWQNGGAQGTLITNAGDRSRCLFGGTTGSGSGDGSIGGNSTVCPANQWSHVAITCDGNYNFYIFVNGVRGTAVNRSGENVAYSRINLGYIGAQPDLSSFFVGYIADARVVNGTAVYTANFTPGTSPLTAVANTQLLTLQNNQPASNNVFLDNSTNNFLVTRAGNTTQGSFSPYGANWSNYFDGNGDYLAATSPSMSGTWTIELWWFPTVGGTQQTFVSYNSGTNGSLGTIGMNIWMNTSNQLVVDNGQVASGLFTGGTFTINAWNHVAVVRNGTTTTGYINGVAVGSNTFTPGGVNQINVGRYPDGNALTFYYATGYISNLRVVTGTAVYTSAFTPPIAPLTAISGTSLLTCQSNRFIDNSSNNYTITRGGDVSIQRFSPFSPSTAYSASVIGGSAYFDGTGDYLTTNYTINWSTYGSYTLEFWVYHTTMSPANQWYFVGGTGGTGNTIFYNYANGRVGVGINGTNEIVSSSGVIKANTWQHIAYTFNGTTTIIYVDGVQVASGTTAIYANSSITLGAGGGSGNASTAMNGYIANMRLSRSVIYSSSFTPPTSPVTGGVLLLNFADAGIVNGTMLNDLETVGDAKLSTAQSKFGGSSMYFDGSGDYLVCQDSPNQEFGSGNLTWEMWINTTNSTQYATLYSRSPASFATGMWSLMMNMASATTGDVGLYVADFSNSGPLLQTTGVSIRDGNWHHIAVVRNGSAWALYVDGTSRATATWAGTIADIAHGTYIGADQYYGRAFGGYIDDFRITKGYARYTSAFTPPTTPFLAK